MARHYPANCFFYDLLPQFAPTSQPSNVARRDGGLTDISCFLGRYGNSHSQIVVVPDGKNLKASQMRVGTETTLDVSMRRVSPDCFLTATKDASLLFPYFWFLQEKIQDRAQFIWNESRMWRRDFQA